MLWVRLCWLSHGQSAVSTSESWTQVLSWPQCSLEDEPHSNDESCLVIDILRLIIEWLSLKCTLPLRRSALAFSPSAICLAWATSSFCWRIASSSSEMCSFWVRYKSLNLLYLNLNSLHVGQNDSKLAEFRSILNCEPDTINRIVNGKHRVLVSLYQSSSEALSRIVEESYLRRSINDKDVVLVYHCLKYHPHHL